MLTTGEPLIGVINAGSSSLKFSFYEGDRGFSPGRSTGSARIPSRKAVGPDGKAIAPPDLAAEPPASPSEVLPAILPWARESSATGGSRRSATASSMAGCGTRGRPA